MVGSCLCYSPLTDFTLKLSSRTPSHLMEFLTDPSTNIATIALAQTYGCWIWDTTFYLPITRNDC